MLSVSNKNKNTRKSCHQASTAKKKDEEESQWSEGFGQKQEQISIEE